MDLRIKGQLFIVCGATSGFGLEILRALTAEDAQAIAIARNEEKLRTLKSELGTSIETLAADITLSSSIKSLLALVGDRNVSGVLVNASGPPAKSFIETTLEDWDQAYYQLLRWKVELTQLLLPKLIRNLYGRFLYIESSAIRQPIENLVLSTSLRLSVAGFVKTVSQEIADKGITFNLLAPGYHNTQAINRIISKKSSSEGITIDQAKKNMEQAIPMKKLGNAANFASLALWLLSPLSEYVTGQVFTIDGGIVKNTL